MSILGTKNSAFELWLSAIFPRYARVYVCVCQMNIGNTMDASMKNKSADYVQI